jgi:hypothetical protein
MSMPFDLEDVVGEAVASLVKRFVWLWGCTTLGWLLVVLSFVALELGLEIWDVLTGGGWSSLSIPDIGDLAFGFLLGVFYPFTSSFAPLYGAFLLGMVLYAFKSDGASPYVWGGAVVVTGLFTYPVAYGGWKWWETTIAVLFWLVCLAGLFFFVKWWRMIQRVKAEIHLMSIAQENQMKREETRERTGGAVGELEDPRD